MDLVLRDGPLSICRVRVAPVTPPAGPIAAVVQLDDEITVVCATGAEPSGAVIEPGWRAFVVDGPLDFALTGVLSSLTAPLAEAKISIFTLSTFGTDVLLVREHDVDAAVSALSGAGHRVRH